MAGEHLPEDIIVKILSKLPVKSLIRFRCVSKRWRSIVSDPQFARLQFKVACEQQTLSRRLLLSFGTTYPFESLDLESTSFQANSSIRKLDFPIPLGNEVKLLCSCNGLVCVALDYFESFHIWNPSIGFAHRLPDPCYSAKRMKLWYYGFGYVSATDDYKLLLVVSGDSVGMVQMFSLRARNWKTIEDNPLNWCPVRRGVLLNEALHWLNCIDFDFADLDSDEEDEPAVIAFDLAREEFWKMPVPIIIAGEHNYRYFVFGVSCDGCLYVICSPHLESLVSVEFWVMREYGKGDSWTKLFNFLACNPPKQILSLDPVVVMQTSAVVVMRTDSGLEVVRIDHHEEKRGETSTIAARDMVPGNRYGMIGYEESLFWLSDYLDDGLIQQDQNPTQGLT